MTRIWFRDPGCGARTRSRRCTTGRGTWGGLGASEVTLHSAWPLPLSRASTIPRPSGPPSHKAFRARAWQTTAVSLSLPTVLTAKEPYFSGSPWVGTGQQGLCWFCSHLNVWSRSLCSGGYKVTRRKSDRWSNVGTDFLWVPSSGFPSSFTDGPYHRRCIVMDVGPLVLSDTDELFDREEFSSPRFQMASYFYWCSISLPSVPWNA